MQLPFLSPRQTRALAVVVLGAAVGRWVTSGRLFRKGGPAASSALPATDRITRTADLVKVGATSGATFAAHQVRRSVASEERKEQLDREYELKSAEQVTEALGNMKGVLMKLGQMASFVNEGFPEHLRSQLATLQSDAPPMSADLAATVIESELGQHPDRLFASWDRKPLASASIGQVHSATLHDGRRVAVKVQYPGVEKAIAADLSNTAFLTQMLGVLFKGLEVAPFVEELKARVSEELDYQLEATRQRRFASLFAGHPTIVVPKVIDELSSAKVLTSELSDGVRFADTQSWSTEHRNLAAETIYRFVFRSFNRHHVFNGDPHPGNYLFEKGGPMGIRVVFLDFGLVKEFTDEEMEVFWTMIRFQVTERDPIVYRKVVEEAGLLVPGAPFTTDELMDYFGYFYHPVMEDKPFTYTNEYAREALKRTFDPNGEHTEKMKWFNLPPAFIVLNRIQWGLNAVLAGLEGTANWRAISEELWPFTDGPPTTPLGELEAAWLDRVASGASPKGHAS
jgi:predicted unusual protein kinase regulating ubiquinone biosynthesis (AarF/ABC1/UbiB family)